MRIAAWTCAAVSLGAAALLAVGAAPQPQAKRAPAPVAAPAAPAQPGLAGPYGSVVRPFLDTYCISCHGPQKQKGDRRYDTLGANFADTKTLELWQDIVDQLNQGEMPPEKAKQPPAEQKKAVIAWAQGELTKARALIKTTNGPTVLRRLNRTEYSRTVRDLLDLGPILSDPTDSFPPDETVDHFENIGSALVTSDFLLDKYLVAAGTFVDRAAVAGPKPAVKKYHFTAPFCPQGHRHDGQDHDGQYQHIRKSTNDDGGFLWLDKLEKGVPVSGYYTLRFKAQAVHRDYPYDESIVGVRKDEPLRCAVVASSSAYGSLEKRTTSDRKLVEYEMPDDAPKWFESRLWLDAGYQPRLTFPNGPNGVKPLRTTIVENYPKDFPRFITFLDPSDKGHPQHEQFMKEHPNYSKKPVRGLGAKADANDDEEKGAGGKRRLTTEGTGNRFNTREGWTAFFSEYMGPRIRVYEIEIEGPLYDQWPTRSYKALFGKFEPTMENAEPILRRFASRAFRRPVSEDELNVLVDLARDQRQHGAEPIEALKVALKATLCSPSFLYLNERPGRLDDYALASRLSYFLWSSMPDDELIGLAAKHELHKPDMLEAQTRRMLADAKAQAFVENFTSRWLQLYKLGTTPPSPAAHREYFMDNLEEAMKTETRMFFRALLDENQPIDRFLDTNFTFVNGGLARLYGIPGIHGTAFQRITLTDAHRGGLLGQASVLTASANGIDTSPVIRGIWVLENILGTPPSPPPPDVKPLEPDIRGATTIRDQLRKHRENATCYECHSKIDPIGFALENFDPIGGWRDRYWRDDGERPMVDPSGNMPDGKSFKDVVELKKVLLARRDQFARCLTEKMLAYSTGRTIDATDRPHVDRIVAGLSSKGYGLRDLVQLVVGSEPFQTK